MWQFHITFLLLEPGHNLTFLSPKQSFHTFIIIGICISSPRLPFSYFMMLLKEPKRESLWKLLCIRYDRETKFSWFWQHFKHVESTFFLFFFYSALLLQLKVTKHHIEQLSKTGTIYLAFFCVCSHVLGTTHSFMKIYEESGLLSGPDRTCESELILKKEAVILMLLCQHLFELNG